ncbi:DUF4221 family protein [Algoriphagus sp. SE2]|uniref:DUF4221 family protein n=1 Tax=Algoriphagus sp. SE2 TaxID=3141536 RepID=UPI0031CD6AB9
MFNLKYFYLLVFSTFLLGVFSCSQKPKNQVPVFDLSDIILDTFYLEKDTITKDLGYNFHYVINDEGEFLVTSAQDRFMIYSYPEGKMIRDQIYDKEGPNGIGSFLQVNFTDDSTSWFVSFQELIRADQFGKVLMRFDLPDGPEERLAINYNNLVGTKAMNTKGKVIIPDVPFVLKKPLLGYENWLLEFDLADSSINYIKFKYPSKYVDFLDDPNFAAYQNGYDEEHNFHLISFPADDSLLVISPQSKKWVYAGVSDKMEFLVGKTVPRGEFTAFLPNEKSSKYSWVDYDPRSQTYIRQAIVITDTEENRSQGRNPLTKLVILDSDFKKSMEVILPFPTRGFPTPKGYYLNIGYPHSEDEVAFVRLDFSKILFP